MTTLAFRVRKILMALLLAVVLATSACAEEQTRWDQAQQESSQTQVATSDESIAGSAFNRFFPEADGDFDLTYTQEKEGFAEAVLERDGTEVAFLSVFDTVNNPEAAEKFQDSSEELAGYPVVDVGSNGTAILVEDRFQVQVRSSDASFSRFDREDWLQRFDLDGLSQLE